MHKDDGGRPAIPPLYTLDNPSDFFDLTDRVFRDYTFTAPPGALLDAGATYWVVIQDTFGDARYVVTTTTDPAETGDGWLIGDQYWFTDAPPDWHMTSTGEIVQFTILN